MVETTDHTPERVAPAVLASLPLLALAGVSLYVIVGWLFGTSPFFRSRPANVADAAAMRDDGQVVYLIEVEHQDPNRAWPLTGGGIATPLEAAIDERRVEMVLLLLRHGARVPDGSPRTALICRADAAEPEIADVLVKTGDNSDPRPCPPAREP